MGVLADTAGLKPNLIIIGAMKSGTSALTRYLSSHQDIFLLPEKSTHFFDRNFSKGLEWYSTRFLAAAKSRVIGEATPNYMYFKEAIPRMAGILPEARLVAVLRNPVDRAYAHYWHSKARGRESLSFEDAIHAEPLRLAEGGREARAHLSYVDRGKYLEQLLNVHDYYPREHLKVVLFEDLTQRSSATYREMCRFLQVLEFTPVDLGRRIGGYSEFRSLAVRRWMSRLHGMPRRIVDRLNTRRGVTYPPMDPATRARLVDRFLDDNLALGEWLGRDLSMWNSYSGS